MDSPRGRRILWRSIFNFPIGYAYTSKKIAMALERNGMEVVYRYGYGPGTPFVTLEPDNFDNQQLRLMSLRPEDGNLPIVCYTQADVFQWAEGPYRIGYTMFEADGLPQEWVRQCNLMDEIWTPTAFNQNTFTEAGVRPSIKIVPLGINEECYQPDGIQYHRNDLFSFISVFEWNERKAPEILLKAFSDEFHLKEPVGLFCKINCQDIQRTIETIKDMGLKPNSGKIFLSFNDRLSDQDMAALYRSVDCFVLPTRGEGWGMPFLEAAACGLPIIATNWGAHLDFISDTAAFLIDLEKTVPAEASSPYYKGLRWAQPSYDHLRALMRQVFEAGPSLREKAIHCTELLRSKYNWDQTAKQIIQHLHSKGF